MPKVSVDIPEELLNDLDRHVGDDGKFVNRSDAVRASIRKTLDRLDEIDERHGRLETDADSGPVDANADPESADANPGSESGDANPGSESADSKADGSGDGASDA